MNKKDKTTESIILDAANKVFIEKGLDGARMQEIADEAKINKSLLHYYYRSKNKLFEEVFNRVFKTFFPDTLKVFASNNSLFEKIENFTGEYISLLQKNPFLPMFVLHELSKRPNKIAEKFSGFIHKFKEIYFADLEKQIAEDVKNQIIIPIKTEHLIVNIMSLCIFPFVAKPIIMKLFFEDDNVFYSNFIDERKKEVAGFIIQSIKMKK